MKPVIYEHPLNETIRACLRLESLFDALEKSKQLTTPLHPIPVILDVLSVLDRPDLKSKLLNVLSNQKNKLHTLLNHPEVDPKTLQSTLDQVSQQHDALLHQHHLAGDLAQHQFFKTLRQQIVHPGGLAPCNAPTFFMWQHQPLADQVAQIDRWLSHLTLQEEIVRGLLQLVRSSRPLQDRHTESGFYQEKTQSDSEIQLIRVEVPSQILPELSAGPHLLVIHFTCPQFSEDDLISSASTHVPFRLACCREIF